MSYKAKYPNIETKASNRVEGDNVWMDISSLDDKAAGYVCQAHVYDLYAFRHAPIDDDGNPIVPWIAGMVDHGHLARLNNITKTKLVNIKKNEKTPKKPVE